jgi:hypothetical protein
VIAANTKEFGSLSAAEFRQHVQQHKHAFDFQHLHEGQSIDEKSDCGAASPVAYFTLAKPCPHLYFFNADLDLRLSPHSMRPPNDLKRPQISSKVQAGEWFLSRTLISPPISASLHSVWKLFERFLGQESLRRVQE